MRFSHNPKRGSFCFFQFESICRNSGLVTMPFAVATRDVRTVRYDVQSYTFYVYVP